MWSLSSASVSASALWDYSSGQAGPLRFFCLYGGTGVSCGRVATVGSLGCFWGPTWVSVSSGQHHFTQTLPQEWVASAAWSNLSSGSGHLRLSTMLEHEMSQAREFTWPGTGERGKAVTGKPTAVRTDFSAFPGDKPVGTSFQEHSPGFSNLPICFSHSLIQPRVFVSSA